MHVVLLGISHQTASVDIREKLSFSEQQIPVLLSRMLGCPGVLEAVVLSTCNRTEIYALVPQLDMARPALINFWAAERGFDAVTLRDHSYFHADEDAIKHLHRVTAGVDSLIVGESQILAQVKAALSTSQEVDASGKFLDALFQQAIKTGKQIRTETSIDRGSVSVSSAAVEVASDTLGSLTDKIVLVYGAGKMSAHTIKAMRQKGAERIYIANRTFERAREAACTLGGEAVTMETARALHEEADVIIACTSSPAYILTRESFAPASGKPRLLIDIAVPRNIDPALAATPGVRIIDLDGLETVAASNREARAKQIVDAEVLIEENLAAFMSRMASFQMVPTIQSFREQMSTLATDEVSEFLAKNQALLERDPRAALERFAHALMGRVMHSPIVNLKSLDLEEQAPHAEALARLFGLEVEDATETYLKKRLPERRKAARDADALEVS